jgi:hypothetical protein
MTVDSLYSFDLTPPSNNKLYHKVSASGPLQTLVCAAPMSAFGGQADMACCAANVGF